MTTFERGAFYDLSKCRKCRKCRKGSGGREDTAQLLEIHSEEIENGLSCIQIDARAVFCPWS